MTRNPVKVSCFEDILELMDTNGWRIYLVFFAASFGTFIMALHTFSYQFLGDTPDYWCHIHELENSTWTDDEIKSLALPLEMSNETSLENIGCSMRDLNYSALSSKTYEEAKEDLEKGRYIISNESVSCDNRDFPSGIETVISQWDLVCDRRILYSVSQIAIEVGMLLGAVVLGILIDRFGRRQMYKICVVTYLLAGFGTAISRTVGLFLFLKMATTVLSLGFSIAGFILVMEISTAKQRSCFGSYFMLPWAVGIITTSGIAYMIRMWSYLELVLTLPGLLLFFIIWILPESPRWLIRQNNYDGAAEVLFWLSNGSSRDTCTLLSKHDIITAMESLCIEESLTSMIDGEKRTKLKVLKDVVYDLCSLIIDPKYRLKTIFVFFCWFSISMVYYGVNYPSTNIRYNAYLSVLMDGVTTIPSYLLMWPVVAFLGRRKTLMALLFLCTASIVLVTIIDYLYGPDEVSTVKLVFYFTGKSAVTAAFLLILTYTSELYPTKNRSLAIGEATAVSRIGTIASPFINDILFGIAHWIPSVVFAWCSIASAIAIFILPETGGKTLPEESRERPPVTATRRPTIFYIGDDPPEEQ